MTNITRTYQHLIAILFFFTISMPTQAEVIKVKKIKGNQAIIETEIPLVEGQTYELVNELVSQDVDYKSNVFKSRGNSVTLGAQLDFLRSSNYQSNNYSLQGRYGWNFSNLEIGAMANLQSTDVGAGATTTILGGGYFDYNLIANRDPKKTIYGAFTLLGVGSTSYPSASTSGGSSTSLQINIGGFLSYFIGETSTALRSELYGIYEQVSTTATQSTLTGFGARALIVFYF